MSSEAIPNKPLKKVFVIGLSKTGTSSLKVMLTALGYKVCGPRKDLLSSVRAGRHSEFINVFDQYDAFEDWPWPLVYRYADEQFGSAGRFILTQRSSFDVWFTSVENHGYGTDPLKSMKDAYGFYRPFGRREAFRRIYENHNASAREYFRDSPERLLEFCLDNGDGWEKLCHFLGHANPGSEVPHKNRTDPHRKPLARLFNRLIAPIYSRLPYDKL